MKYRVIFDLSPVSYSITDILNKLRNEEALYQVHTTHNMKGKLILSWGQIWRHYLFHWIGK